MACLNHVGIAVANMSRLTELFSILDLQVNHIEKVDEQGVKIHFLPLPLEPSNLELLEPTDPKGAVAQFIQKRGPGIHHLSFGVGVGELILICGRLKEAGFQLLYDQPRVGAHGAKINFVHPASAGGILIEVMEAS